MTFKAGEYQHSDAEKAKISAAVQAQWADPEVRARRSRSLRAAWERRRSMITVCPACGTCLEDEGRY